jgi:type I restriction enzyme S subunit
LYYALCNADIPNTGYNRHFKWLKEVDIPEYSEEEQEDIVLKLDKISHLITLRKQQLAKLDELVKSRFVEMFGDVLSCTEQFETARVANVADVGSSKRIFQNELQIELTRKLGGKT